MNPLNKQVFVCLDCETTGLDTQVDRVIEIGIALFTLDEILESFETLIDPEIPIPAASTTIHHITDEMVRGKPRIEEVLSQILKMAGTYPIVGHGVKFDVDILMQSAQRGGLHAPIKDNRIIDTLRMARKYADSPTNSLEALRKHFNIGYEGAHRAMNDVIVNIHVFKQLMRGYGSLKDLYATLERPIVMERIPLGKYKGRKFIDVPVNYLRWARHQNFDMDLLYSINLELKRRSKGDLFHQSTNPFHGL